MCTVAGSKGESGIPAAFLSGWCDSLAFISLLFVHFKKVSSLNVYCLITRKINHFLNYHRLKKHTAGLTCSVLFHPQASSLPQRPGISEASLSVSTAPTPPEPSESGLWCDCIIHAVGSSHVQVRVARL